MERHSDIYAHDLEKLVVTMGGTLLGDRVEGRGRVRVEGGSSSWTPSFLNRQDQRKKSIQHYYKTMSFFVDFNFLDFEISKQISM